MSNDILQNPLTWHQAAWLNTIKQFRSGQMPHAYLLSAEADTGKRLYAIMLAQFLLCCSPGPQAACGSCPMCLLNKAGSNPDLLIVEPEDGSKIIKVEQIRDLKKFLETSSHSFGKRVIILDSAENLGVSSANALLKGLEEPPADVMFILLTDRPKAVLATITSRCQVISLPRPEREQSLAWLRIATNEAVTASNLSLLLDFAQGRPLAGKAMYESGTLEQQQEMGDALLQLLESRLHPCNLASRYAKTQTGDMLRLLLYWLNVLCKYQLTGAEEHLKSDTMRRISATLLNPAYDRDAHTRALFSLYNEVVVAQTQLGSTSNPNAQLMLEDLLMQLNRLVRMNSHNTSGLR
ncbi:MAG: DNA polymerase III subunit delta' C-terminal domain-containing protein [Gammaproteobacteria bacterium]|nr:DNA polymerase III subunit delta' C-terminal domain-containing protein [Gammaproteobacteria bacterium]MDP2141161.1 DNA polymerase III subunit delta' C-terminal domain-containing protein [Gammaproteobacteria bacterium]MDP2349165.1 DNA polymerase III subunit delta' C-terminal domain-containing protein [Gammaproteobacteria bacterium]